MEKDKSKETGYREQERYKEAGLAPQERAEDLLARMTWEEKLVQMAGYNPAAWSSDDFDRDYPLGAGQVSYFAGVDKANIYEAARWQREMQKKIMERSRFGIPAIFHVETLCGVMLPQAMSLPSGMGQAASFDTKHQEQVMRLVGQQARAAGASQAFSPVLDVSRDPRFGRQGETGGEDPALISAMGCASVKGLQQDGCFFSGVLATAKHFLGYHNSEGGIHAATCDIPERLLREVYAKPFQAAISKADMRGIMPCYGSINGEPVSVSRRILSGLLRTEMGFDGLTVSDYCAVQESHERQGAAKSLGEAGKKAILAGMLQELPSGNCFMPSQMEEYRGDEAVLQAVDDAVRTILTEKFRLGLFENPYAASDEVLRKLYENPQNKELSYRSALESLVLVKNDGVLPLTKTGKKIAVVGYHGNAMRALYGGYTFMSMTESSLGARNTMAGVGQTGEKDAMPAVSSCWHGSIVEREHPDAEKLAKKLVPEGRNLLEALRELMDGCSFTHSFGYPYVGDDCSSHAEALEAAKEADIILMTVGGKYGTGTTASMGEGIDGTDINLPVCQETLIEKMAALGKPIVLVHFGGRPISSNAADQYADAILEAWNPGEKGAEAIVHTLFGDYNPGGRMPVTTAYCAGQIPIYYNHPNGSSYHQGTISAFRQYMDCPHEPRYYFGHGLSYTKFEYGNLQIFIDEAETGRGAGAVSTEETGTEKEAAAVRIQVEVENTGSMDGDEVVQFYIRDPYASMVRPVMELAGFCRIHLKKGEKKTAVFKMELSQLAFLDQEMNWKVEAGEIDVLVGASAGDIRLKGQFEISESFLVDGKRRGFFAEVQIQP